MNARSVIKSTKHKSILQFPEELEKLLEFMYENKVKSYLEIGIFSGHMLMLMDDTFKLEKVCACDISRPDSLDELKYVNFYHGSCYEKPYLKWRENIGHIDMVFIDAIHKRRYVRKDYKREISFPHRFIAFHDIRNIRYPKLSEFWDKEVHGSKVEFVNKNKKSRLISFDNETKDNIKEYKQKYGISCGIGVCWDD